MFSRIPLLIRLRDASTPFTINELLSFYLEQHCGIRAPISLFHNLMKEGRIILFLDGFDELTDKSDIEFRKKYFNEISKIFYNQNKIILTSRPGYFVTDEEIDQLFKKVKYIGHNIDTSSKQSRAVALSFRKRAREKFENMLNSVINFNRSLISKQSIYIVPERKIQNEKFFSFFI